MASEYDKNMTATRGYVRTYVSEALSGSASVPDGLETRLSSLEAAVSPLSWTQSGKLAVAGVVVDGTDFLEFASAVNASMAGKQRTLIAGDGISIDQTTGVISSTASGVSQDYVDSRLSGKQDSLEAGPGIVIAGNVISSVGGGGGDGGGDVTTDVLNASVEALEAKIAAKQDPITAGAGIQIVNGEISVSRSASVTPDDLRDLENDIASRLASKQDALTAGAGIAISNGVVSSTVSTDSFATSASVASMTTDLLKSISAKQDKFTVGSGLRLADGVLSAVAQSSGSSGSSVDQSALDAKQDRLVAGNGINITDNIISLGLRIEAAVSATGQNPVTSKAVYDYATGNFVTKNEAGTFVRASQVSSAVESAMGSYATRDYVTTALSPYVTSSTVATTVSTALADYARTSDLAALRAAVDANSVILGTIDVDEIYDRVSDAVEDAKKGMLKYAGKVASMANFRENSDQGVRRYDVVDDDGEVILSPGHGDCFYVEATGEFVVVYQPYEGDNQVLDTVNFSGINTSEFVSSSDFSAHVADSVRHVSESDRAKWNAAAPAADVTALSNALTTHTIDASVHVNQTSTVKWDTTATNFLGHVADEDMEHVHLTFDQRTSLERILENGVSAPGPSSVSSSGYEPAETLANRQSVIVSVDPGERVRFPESPRTTGNGGSMPADYDQLGYPLVDRHGSVVGYVVKAVSASGQVAAPFTRIDVVLLRHGALDGALSAEKETDDVFRNPEGKGAATSATGGFRVGVSPGGHKSLYMSFRTPSAGETNVSPTRYPIADNKSTVDGKDLPWDIVTCDLSTGELTVHYGGYSAAYAEKWRETLQWVGRGLSSGTAVPLSFPSSLSASVAKMATAAPTSLAVSEAIDDLRDELMDEIDGVRESGTGSEVTEDQYHDLSTRVTQVERLAAGKLDKLHTTESRTVFLWQGTLEYGLTLPGSPTLTYPDSFTGDFRATLRWVNRNSTTGENSSIVISVEPSDALAFLSLNRNADPADYACDSFGNWAVGDTRVRYLTKDDTLVQYLGPEYAAVDPVTQLATIRQDYIKIMTADEGPDSKYSIVWRSGVKGKPLTDYHTFARLDYLRPTTTTIVTHDVDGTCDHEPTLGSVDRLVTSDGIAKAVTGLAPSTALDVLESASDYTGAKNLPVYGTGSSVVVYFPSASDETVVENDTSFGPIPGHGVRVGTAGFEWDDLHACPSRFGMIMHGEAFENSALKPKYGDNGSHYGYDNLLSPESVKEKYAGTRSDKLNPTGARATVWFPFPREGTTNYVSWHDDPTINGESSYVKSPDLPEESSYVQEDGGVVPPFTVRFSDDRLEVAGNTKNLEPETPPTFFYDDSWAPPTVTYDANQLRLASPGMKYHRVYVTKKVTYVIDTGENRKYGGVLWTQWYFCPDDGSIIVRQSGVCAGPGMPGPGDFTSSQNVVYERWFRLFVDVSNVRAPTIGRASRVDKNPTKGHFERLVTSGGVYDFTKGLFETDTVQLGAGTNRTKGTLQFRGYRLLDSVGHIPPERMNLITEASEPVRVYTTLPSGLEGLCKYWKLHKLYIATNYRAGASVEVYVSPDLEAWESTDIPPLAQVSSIAVYPSRAFVCGKKKSGTNTAVVYSTDNGREWTECTLDWGSVKAVNLISFRHVVYSSTHPTAMYTIFPEGESAHPFVSMDGISFHHDRTPEYTYTLTPDYPVPGGAQFADGGGGSVRYRFVLPYADHDYSAGPDIVSDGLPNIPEVFYAAGNAYTAPRAVSVVDRSVDVFGGYVPSHVVHKSSADVGMTYNIVASAGGYAFGTRLNRQYLGASDHSGIWYLDRITTTSAGRGTRHYAASESGRYLHTIENGMTCLGDYTPDAFTSSAAPNARTERTLVAACDEGMFYSSDFGKTWVKATNFSAGGLDLVAKTGHGFVKAGNLVFIPLERTGIAWSEDGMNWRTVAEDHAVSTVFAYDVNSPRIGYFANGGEVYTIDVAAQSLTGPKGIVSKVSSMDAVANDLRARMYSRDPVGYGVAPMFRRVHNGVGTDIRLTELNPPYYDVRNHYGFLPFVNVRLSSDSLSRVTIDRQVAVAIVLPVDQGCGDCAAITVIVDNKLGASTVVVNWGQSAAMDFFKVAQSKFGAHAHGDFDKNHYFGTTTTAWNDPDGYDTVKKASFTFVRSDSDAPLWSQSLPQYRKPLIVSDDPDVLRPIDAHSSVLFTIVRLKNTYNTVNPCQNMLYYVTRKPLAGVKGELVVPETHSPGLTF